MSRIALLVAAVTVAGLSACSSAPARTFGQPEIDSINQLVKEFIATYNAKDATKVSLLFTDGGVVMPPNASTVRGTENVRIQALMTGILSFLIFSGLLVISAIDYPFVGSVKVQPEGLLEVLKDFSATARP